MDKGRFGLRLVSPTLVGIVVTNSEQDFPHNLAPLRWREEGLAVLDDEPEGGGGGGCQAQEGAFQKRKKMKRQQG